MEAKSSSEIRAKATSKSARAGLLFPVSRFQRNLRKGNYANHIGTAGSVYMTSVIEYLAAEILELAGAAAAEHHRVRIITRHIMMAIKNDVELNELLKDACFSESGVMPNVHPVLINRSKPKTAVRKDSENYMGAESKGGQSEGDQSEVDESEIDESEGDEDDESEGDEGEVSAVAGSQNF